MVDIIKHRCSMRAFTPHMPPRELLLECREAASWAPIPTSQQPWQFIVLAGKPLQRVCRTIQETFQPVPNSRPSLLSTKTQELLNRGRQDHFAQMVSFLKTKIYAMREAGNGNLMFHGPPMGVIFGVYPCKDQNYLKATVAAMQNFMRAAWSRGLGTCWMNAVSICQEAIKSELTLADELLLVDGIAVGYPDPDSPINNIPGERMPIEAVVQWLDT